MTEQEDKTLTTASPPEETAPAATPVAPAEEAKPAPVSRPVAKKPASKKPVPKAKPTAGSNSRKKTAAASKPKAANSAPDLNSKNFPLHPGRIWPD